jgi:hypothetical protein
MASPSFWSTYDTTTVVNPRALGFAGATFDGRYIYLAPTGNLGFPDAGQVQFRSNGIVERYDTTATFAAANSWSTVDIAPVTGNGEFFFGAASDGRYVYLVPSTDSTGNGAGVVARYDTQATFGVEASWSVFDTTAVNPGAGGYQGATFDGRYLYLVPSSSPLTGSSDGLVVRFDTQIPFGGAASWSTFDMTTANPLAAGFSGAVFDGRYVYFVPQFDDQLLDGGTPLAGGYHGHVMRYDTQAAFGLGSSWAGFDATTVDPRARGFSGAAFDGRYVYLAPLVTAQTQDGGLAAVPDGLVVRYDTRSTFETGSSWSTFDTTTITSGAKGYAGAAFDGRYVYFVPLRNAPGRRGSPASDGIVARYDTQASFGATASWSTFDIATIDPMAKGFLGAAFDGRYVYFVQASGGVVARFDAKTPASMPSLPAFHGSFF